MLPCLPGSSVILQKQSEVGRRPGWGWLIGGRSIPGVPARITIEAFLSPNALLRTPTRIGDQGPPSPWII